MSRVLSTGEVAELLQQPRWHISRIFENGDLPEPDRIAGKRVIRGDQLPAIIDALKARGWLAPKEPTVAT